MANALATINALAFVARQLETAIHEVERNPQQLTKEAKTWMMVLGATDTRPSLFRSSIAAPPAR